MPRRQPTSYRPDAPVFLYDADCGFCITWMDYFQSVVGDRVQFIPYHDVVDEIPEYTADDCARAVHFIEPDGEVTSGALATFRMLSFARRKRHWLWCYEHLPLFPAVSEWFYRFVANHRDGFFTLTKVVFGVPIRDPSYTALRDIFLRALGVIYLVAFASFGLQMAGLIGSNGILPVQQYLGALWNELGPAAYWQAPTLFWFSASDGALLFVFILGMVASLGVISNIMRRSALAVALACYLSLVIAGQVFMGYQWDALLVEAGFLAVIFSLFMPAIWAFRALLFKLMFISGIGKLVGGDPTWWDLTALDYHFMTQPLPTPLAWYMHQLPLWLHKAMTAAALGIELIVPIFFFAPRRIRFIAAWLTIGLEVLILLTGNYTFFNVLTIAIALLLFDDHALSRVIPDRLLSAIRQFGRDIRSRPGRLLLTGMVAILFVFSVLQGVFMGLPPGLSHIHKGIAPFRVSNTYGLFITMTTSRPEIVIQGSRDGKTWKSYQFSYKPGPPDRSPPIVAPYQPRLDWQMWFLGLKAQRSMAQGGARYPSWFRAFALNLMVNNETITGLLQRNPFGSEPPNYIRAVVYNYTFTDSWGSAQWWERSRVGVYLEPISRSSVQRSRNIDKN